MGVIEAKPEGKTLSGVAEQTNGYITSIPPNLPHVQEPLPFSYETTGVETYFRDIRDPDTRSRRVFAFHQPETLKSWMLNHDTLRARLMGMADMNELQPGGLRLCQFEAIQNLEQSFARAKLKALIQMATGTGNIYSKPYGRRHLIYVEIKQLAEAINKTPYNLTPELLWQVYEQLDRSKIKGAGPQKLLTNIISLIRFATGKSDVLEPFPETVDRRFESWI